MRGTSIRFSATLDARFFEELASERRVVKYQRGAPKASWERIPGKRAEALDCVVYALAVRNLVGVNLDNREKELSDQGRTVPRQTIVKSNWLSINTIREHNH